jgi:mannose-1-phosphate guanylyltransferase
LTDECPKPLVPIGDRPLLAHIAENLQSRGYDAIAVNTHHLPERFADFSVAGVTLHWSYEPQILGSAGGVRQALPFLTPPLVVCNGDIWGLGVSPDLVGGLANAPICLQVAPTTGPGTVGLDDRGRVVRLRGERFGQEHRGADYVGVMAIGPSASRRLPQRGCLIGDLCLPLLREGAALSVAWCEDTWLDVGTLHGYLEANQRWLDGRGLAWYSGPDVQLAVGVEVEHSVIGAGARLRGAGQVVGCVVWPGADVEAPLRNAVVTSAGRVVSPGPTP